MGEEDMHGLDDVKPKSEDPVFAPYVMLKDGTKHRRYDRELRYLRAGPKPDFASIPVLYRGALWDFVNIKGKRIKDLEKEVGDKDNIE